MFIAATASNCGMEIGALFQDLKNHQLDYWYKIVQL